MFIPIRQRNQKLRCTHMAVIAYFEMLFSPDGRLVSGLNLVDASRLATLHLIHLMMDRL